MASRAIHRLMRDLEEIKNEPLATVAALPEPNDIFSWHMNLRPCDGPFADSVFHFTIKFPHDYPHSPPENVLLLSTDMPGHPNVFGSYICLDMLKDYTSTMRYGGWTTAYSCMSLALQLQSFLFAERVDQDYGGSQTTHWMPQTIARVRESNRTFTMRIDGDHMHTHDAPWPPFAVSSPPHPVASSVSNLTQLIERVTVSPPSSPHRRPRRGEQQEAKHVDSSPALVLTADDAPPVQLTDLAPDELVMITDHLRTEDLLAFTRTCTTFRSVDRSFSLFARRQLCCFHTKARYGSEPDLILGVGLSLKHHTDNNLKEVDTPFDVLSEAAFVTDGVRLSVWKLPFTTFLPLAIDEGHFDRAVPALHRAAQAAFGEGARTIEILELLATAMNSMVVKLFSLHTDTRRPPPLHASEAALDAYCGFHHLLLCAAHRWPAIRVEAQRRVTAFLADGDGRSKSNTPDLGASAALTARLSCCHAGRAPESTCVCVPWCVRALLYRPAADRPHPQCPWVGAAVLPIPARDARARCAVGPDEEVCPRSHLGPTRTHGHAAR